MSILLNFILHLIALLPLSVAHRLGAVTGKIINSLPHSYQESSLKNIQICFPSLSTQEAKLLKQNSFKESGKALWELGAIWFWPEQRILRLVKKISGQEIFDDAISKGKGVIIAAPHIGCWEMVGLYCSTKNTMTSLYRPPRANTVENLMSKARQRFGANLVPTDNSGIRKLYAALRRNELIGILPDQDPRNEGNVFAPYFGFPTNTATLLPRLAQKTGATVIFTFAERLKKGQGYHIHFIAADNHIHDNNVETAAAAVNLGVEKCIRITPEQYQWSYKRFKTRPAGEAKIY